MKFTIKRSVLLQNLKQVDRAISKRTTVPILTGALIEANQDGSLTLTGSNSDITIVRTIKPSKKNDLKVDDAGATVLKADLLTKIIDKMPKDDISFEAEKNYQVKISSGEATFDINNYKASEYINLPSMDNSTATVLSGKTLNSAIAKTVFACSSEESRPTLTGVHFVLKNGQLNVVATDSHRLSSYITKVDNPDAKNANIDIIIPASNLEELSHLLDDKNDVTMKVASSQLLFKFDDTLFFSRSLEGNYPDTSQLIPNKYSTRITLDANYLLDVVDRASLVSHISRNNVVQLVISAKKDSVHVSADGGDAVGSVNDVVPVDKVDGKDLNISFNPDYLADALKAVGNSKIVIDFLSPLRPFTIATVDKKGTVKKNFNQLITPVRTF